MMDDLRKIFEESFRMMGYKQVKPEQWTAIKVFVSGVDVFVYYMMMDDLCEIVEESFRMMGYEQVNPEQWTAIKAFVSGVDVFVALPTGFGKSLIYANLPLFYDNLKNWKKSIVIVVSPLLALMKDQVDVHSSKGIRAAAAVSSDTNPDIKQRILEGNYQLVFISPESLLTVSRWRGMLKDEPYVSGLVAFVVDEAHCVKNGNIAFLLCTHMYFNSYSLCFMYRGDTFRHEFSCLRDVHSLIPTGVNMIALTAMASKSLQQSVIQTLGMRQPFVLSVSPHEPNITLAVTQFKSIEDDFEPVVSGLRQA